MRDLINIVSLCEDASTIAQMVTEPSFRHWFDQSAVRKGNIPLIMFHGTKATFDRFDRAHLGSGSNDGDSSEYGFYFTTSKRLAARYAKNGRLVHAFLRVLNPYRVTATQWGMGEGLSPEEARKQGYDGYLISGQEGGDTWIVFDDDAIWQVS